MLLILILSLYAQVILGKKCDSECHQNLALRIKNLTTSFPVPKNLLNVANQYNFITRITKNVDDVTLELKLLDQVFKQRLNELYTEKQNYDEKIKNCSKVIESYEDLKRTAENLSEKFDNLSRTYEDITDRIKKSKETSLKQEKELKSLLIPDFAANNYICNISLADKVEKIISIGNELTIALNYMKGKIFEKLKKENAEIKKLIDEIMKLDTKINLPLKIDKKTEKLLKKISEQIQELQKDLSGLDVANIIDSSKWVKKHDEQLKELKKLLSSDENIKRIKKQIKESRKTIEFINERNAVKQEFGNIRKIVNHLQSGGVCKIIDFTVEP